MEACCFAPSEKKSENQVVCCHQVHCGVVVISSVVVVVKMDIRSFTLCAGIVPMMIFMDFMVTINIESLRTII